MRIAIISDWFSEKMGYAENALPKALAALGHDVHLITSDLQPYATWQGYKETYEPFIGPAIVPCSTKSFDGFTLHRLPHLIIRSRIHIRGLLRVLRSLRPQIVQTFDPVALSTIEAAFLRVFSPYLLFTGNHVCASVFPPALRKPSLRERISIALGMRVPGMLVAAVTEKSYPATIDCQDIEKRFCGVPERKLVLSPLGVDTLSFHPVSGAPDVEERNKLRSSLGFSSQDIVCIYTGRFSDDKDPMCLAKAVGKLVHQGKPFQGLFVGNGSEKNTAMIRSTQGCVIRDFVPAKQLPTFYRAADIGVWPRQESTSMLDAAACGLPLVVSARVQARERIDGNGITYDEGNPDDLARALESLQKIDARATLGSFGSRKIADNYSWSAIAIKRARDYEAAIDGNPARKTVAKRDRLPS